MNRHAHLERRTQGRVVNLAPRQMRGEVSQGMLLAASDPATAKVIVISPSEQVATGSKVS